MKTLSKILIAAGLAFAAASLPLQVHAIHRSPVVDAHLEGTKGQWRRGGQLVKGPGGKKVAAYAPELDPASAASSFALLFALLMLASQRRREPDATPLD